MSQKLSPFVVAVQKVVRNIPKGSTMSYQAVATAAQYPGSERAVANVMSRNFDSSIPCHRVIRKDGTLGGYNRGGTPAKQTLLEKEGAIIK